MELMNVVKENRLSWNFSVTAIGQAVELPEDQQAQVWYFSMDAVFTATAELKHLYPFHQWKPKFLQRQDYWWKELW